MLAQWIHQGVDVWHAGPIGTFVEEEVTAWLRALVGIGDDGWGVLTSGGVMANLMALTVARDVWLATLRSTAGPPRGGELEGVRVYASDQTHFSISRALGVLGFPDDTLVVIDSDDRFRLRSAPVAEAIERDRAAGFTPLAIAAVAGSTNTGSVDDTPGLAEVAEREGVWLHVDAAYGGAARLSPRDAHRVPGLERADSVTIDPHKWFFQAYDIGALVVRRRDDLLRTFHRSPEYYRSDRPEDEALDWYQYSLEGTRRFRGLKLWMSWKQLGTDGLGRLIERNNDLAAYLAERCAAEPGFEAWPAEPELSVVCFRHLPAGHEGWPPEGARRLPGPAAARPRGERRGMGERHDPARTHVSPRGDRELPLDRSRRRPHARRRSAGCPHACSRSSTSADRRPKIGSSPSAAATAPRWWLHGPLHHHELQLHDVDAPQLTALHAVAQTGVLP